MGQKKKKLSISLLALMNVAIILSLRGLPLMAKEGLSLVFYLLFSLLIFFIPSALISAELATGWPELKGVFGWVSEAFGKRVGFLAIWLQWLQNIFWYPTVLSFAAGSLAYLLLDPSWAGNPLYNIVVILVVYWGSTLVSLKGIRASGKLSSIATFLGTILPAFFIIFLGIIWFLKGNESLLNVDQNWLPDFAHFSNISFLAGIVLLFSGIEVNAVHAMEVDNPKKSYPTAIFISVFLIFIIFFLGSLSIAMVLPEEEISLTAGVMQAFTKFLSLYGLESLVPVLGFLIALGVIGGVAAWIVGPSKGLLATSKEGLLPSFLAHTNEAHAPSHILFIQGTIVTLLSLVYWVMPTVNSAFFLLSDLTVILYLTMYVLLFSAFLKLRYQEPKKERPYHVPGKMFGAWLIALIGIMGALFAIFVGFFPPSQLQKIDPHFYITFLVISLLIALVIPELLLFLRRKRIKK